MSLFGYPATVTHHMAILDSWNRVTGYTLLTRKAKVIEEQKLIRNAQGEDVKSIAEIHLEGLIDVGMQDYFEYINGLGQKLEYRILHLQPLKFLGTDNVKKVIVYA